MAKKKVHVRSHKRRLPSGKITTVKAHTRNINSVKKYRRIANLRDTESDIEEGIEDIEDETEDLKENIEDIEEETHELKDKLSKRENKNFAKNWNKIMDTEGYSEKGISELNNLILEQNVINLDGEFSEEQLDKFAGKLNSLSQGKKKLSQEDLKELREVFSN
jgi:anion-transporting  ArsA/GET3 family ATPase